MLEISSKKIVTTRKDHECYGCYGTIGKGKDSVHVRGKEDGMHVTFYLHLECHVTAMKQKLFAEGFTKGAVKQIQEQNNDYSVADTSFPF